MGHYFTFAALTLLALGQTPALADLSVVASGQPGAGVSDIEAIASHSLVLQQEFVFSESERAAIRDLGDPLLAASKKIRLRNAQSVDLLRSFATIQGLRVELSHATIPVAIEADPFEPEQWYLNNAGTSQYSPIDDLTDAVLPGKPGEDIGFTRAHPEAPGADGSAPIIVAVLDTGVDFNHPDLKSRIVRKPQECTALDQYKACLKEQSKAECDKQWAAFDSDQNGYPLDCSGWNVTVGKNPLNGIQGNGNATDDNGHGTHVSGVIAAEQNSIGVRGISQRALILPVKVITASPKGPVRPQSDDVPSPVEGGNKWNTGFSDVIARGLLYAIRSGARVANLSLAWPKTADSELMRSMVRLAQKNGMIIVAAAGNDSTEATVFPCYYSGVICVGAHGPDGTLARFSNHGTGVDVAAPGINILSTWPLTMRPLRFTDAQGYEFKNGTSMASPIVAGVVARLLSEGYEAEETFARVLLGTRSHNATDTASGHITRFGNIDLPAALNLSPQPLILPLDKTPLRVEWNRGLRAIDFSIPLKNFWGSSKKVRLFFELGEKENRVLELATQEKAVSDWKNGLELNIENRLLLKAEQLGRIPSEINFTIRVQNEEGRETRLPLKIDLFVPITRDNADPEIQILPISGGAIPSTASLRTITYVGPHFQNPPRSYLSTEKTHSGLTFSLFSLRDTSVALEIQRTLPAPKGNLLALYRLDWNLDGKDEFVFVYTLTHPQGKKNAAFRFDYLDESLNPQESVEYISDAAMIPETFQWFNIGGKLSPAWITAGFTPPNEKSKTYDPWDPNPRDTQSLRLYYIAADGLRTIQPPKDYSFAALLPQDFSSNAPGVLQALLAQGESFNLKFSIAEISHEQEPVVGEKKALAMARFRMLVGADSFSPVFSLEPKSATQGAAFSAPSSQGTYRTSVITNGIIQSDTILRAVTQGDIVLRMAGTFRGNGVSGAFTQTHYNLQYHDLLSGQAVVTSLHRFSFLPQMAFLKSFVPTKITDKTTGSQSPAILAFGDLSATDSTEALLPVYGEEGKLESLFSPARLKLEAGQGCARIGNPVEADASHPTRILFYCGDQFLAVPLTW